MMKLCPYTQKPCLEECILYYTEDKTEYRFKDNNKKPAPTYRDGLCEKFGMVDYGTTPI